MGERAKLEGNLPTRGKVGILYPRRILGIPLGKPPKLTFGFRRNFGEKLWIPCLRELLRLARFTHRWESSGKNLSGVSISWRLYI